MLDSLQRIVQEVSSAHDLDEALALIVERVKASMNADVCSVYLSDEARREYVLMATDGLRPGAVGRVRIPFGKGVVGLCASRAEPVNLENAPDHPAFIFIASTGEAPFHGFLGVPIVRRRKVMGVLVVQQREQRRYIDEEVAFLVTLAAQLAGSITQAELRQSLDQMDVDDLDTLFVDGVACARGLGIGRALVLFPEARLDSVPDKKLGLDLDLIEAECSRFRLAVDAELEELKSLAARMGRILSPGDQALFDAYAMLLGSDSLVNGTLERIHAGNWAPGALRATVAEYANVFDIFDRPLHPYTRGLLRSIPSLHDPKHRLTTVDEVVRDAAEFKTLAGYAQGVVPWWPETPPEVRPRNVPGHPDYCLHEIEPNRWVGCWMSEHLAAHPSRKPDLQFRRESVESPTPTQAQ